MFFSLCSYLCHLSLKEVTVSSEETFAVKSTNLLADLLRQEMFAVENNLLEDFPGQIVHFMNLPNGLFIHLLRVFSFT